MRTFAQQSKPQPPAATTANPAPAPAGHLVSFHSASPPSAFDFTRVPPHAKPDLQGGRLYRHAAGPAAEIAPPLVHEVLRGQGRPLPAAVLRDAEARMGQHFADVRIHTDARAGASADAVAANAYTVGRQIVFAPGRFDPFSAQGRQLLTHELSHASAHRPGAPTPSGNLRISTPSEAAERHAASVADGTAARGAVAPAAEPGLFRQTAGPVGLNSVSVNHRRVTVPVTPGLAFSATKSPANAPGVTLAVAGDNATIDPGTTINNSTGAITVGPGQTGGSAHVAASQNATAGGITLTSTTPATAPFNFTAIPSGITSTAASPANATGMYGGQFIHTFTSPGGGQTALERSHVNERFAGASGTTLTIRGLLGTLNITVNNPNAASSGWDLDAAGDMTGPDNVTWGNTIDARPFVRNASHPAPNPGLPQELVATQSFRNLTFPAQTYGAAAVATTTHRRAIEDRSNLIKAITSANSGSINQEIVEDYAGPTIFRRARAAPASIPVAAAAPPGGTAPAASTTTIAVDAEGQSATPTFSVRTPNLGCTIDTAGVLTPGTTPGTVTVRAGDSVNFDETTVTLTPLPAPATPAPTPTPTPGPGP